MDLDRCPRCGNAWPGGDKCPMCGFVPIGAGLEKLPKKKKRRARKYVEPGSSRGLMMTTLACLLGWFMFRVQPWRDDWQFFRDLIGQGRPHDVVGEWEITETMPIPGKQAVIGPHTHKGTVSFSDKGKVKFDLHGGEDAVTDASGKYQVVRGTTVAIDGLQNSSDSAGSLPSSMKMNLVWSGTDKLIVGCNGSEVIYLLRHPKGNPLSQFLQMVQRPGKGAAPGQMRGVIATMQKQIDTSTE